MLARNTVGREAALPQRHHQTAASLIHGLTALWMCNRSQVLQCPCVNLGRQHPMRGVKERPIQGTAGRQRHVSYPQIQVLPWPQKRDRRG